MTCICRKIAFIITLNICLILTEKITEKNQEKILKGEWLLKFYADWCTACQQFAPIWDQLSIMDYQNSAIRFGEINIDQQQHLSVKYSVKYLPTIYHVKDGVVRLYDGKKEIADIEEFINTKKYLKINPLSWYNDPNGLVIAILLQFVNAYDYFMEMQHKLVQQHGYSEKVATSICYSLASLALLLISFICAIILIPIINFFLPKQPIAIEKKSTSVGSKKKKHTFDNKSNTSYNTTTNDSDSSDTNIVDSDVNSNTKTNSKNDVLRERRRSQQKKRSSRE